MRILPQNLKTWLTAPPVIALLIMGGLIGALLAYTTQPFAGRRHTVAPPAGDPIRLEAHVQALVACGPREMIHPEALDAAAAYIEGKLRAAGGRLGRQPYEVRGRQGGEPAGPVRTGTPRRRARAPGAGGPL